MPRFGEFIGLGEYLRVDCAEFVRLAVVKHTSFRRVRFVADTPSDFKTESVLFTLGIGDIGGTVAPIPYEVVRRIDASPVKTAERIFLRERIYLIAPFEGAFARHTVLLRRHKEACGFIFEGKHRRDVFKSV